MSKSYFPCVGEDYVSRVKDYGKISKFFHNLEIMEIKAIKDYGKIQSAPKKLEK